jgi:hypothetical protein
MHCVNYCNIYLEKELIENGNLSHQESAFELGLYHFVDSKVDSAIAQK